VVRAVAQAVLVEALEGSPHMEHMARWLQVMGVVHSASIQQRRAELMPILRRLNKVRTTPCPTLRIYVRDGQIETKGKANAKQFV